MTAARGLAFTTAVRVIHRVHHDAAVGRLDSHPALAPGFADGDVLVIGVANLADGRHAIDEHATGFAGRQLEQSPFAFLCDQLCLSTGGAHHLRAFAGLELDVVHRGAGRDVFQRKRIADQDVRVWTANDLLPDLQSDGLQDVALFAVRIIQQSDARRAVGIVLDGSDGRGNAGLIALEVDRADLALVSTAAVP